MKKQRLFKLVALLVLCCAMLGCGKEDPLNPTSQKNSIYGTVTDFATGELISNANVRLNPIGETTLTGSDGMFQFADVPDGNYSLSLSKNGYVDLDDDYVLEMKNGKSLRRDVQLKNAFESFKLTVNGVEIDTLNFGRTITTPLSFSVDNNGTTDIVISVDHTGNWLELRSGYTIYSYDEFRIKPNTSRLFDVNVLVENLNNGANNCYIRVSSNTMTKTIVVLAQANIPVVDIPSVVWTDTGPVAGGWTYWDVFVRSSVLDNGGIPITERGFEYYYGSNNHSSKASCGIDGNNNFERVVRSTDGKITKIRTYAKNEFGEGCSDWVYVSF